jgi:hypothetical protein
MGADAEVNTMDLDDVWSLRGSDDVVGRDNARELPAADLAAEPQVPSEPPQRDWGVALAIVHDAAKALRLGEERIEELKRQIQEQADQYNTDLKALHAQLLGAHGEIESANLRAQAAEQQAKDATDWLARLDDAIGAHLGSIDRPI